MSDEPSHSPKSNPPQTESVPIRRGYPDPSDENDPFWPAGPRGYFVLNDPFRPPGPRGVIGIPADLPGTYGGRLFGAVPYPRYDPSALGDPLQPGFLIRVEEGIQEDKYEIRAELPGVDPGNNIDITVEYGELKITAIRIPQEQLSYSEFTYGSSSRTIRLPAGADEDDITAKYQHGILIISVAMSAGYSSKRQIEIDSEETS